MMNNSEPIDADCTELGPVDTDRTLARNLALLRAQFQSNKNVHVIIQSSVNRAEKIEKIKSELGFDPEDPDTFENAIGALIDESAMLMQAPPSNYLVDNSTGKIVKRLEEGDIFTPPDYIGEDGLSHQSIPKIHPKICLSLIAEKTKINRQKEIQEIISRPEHEMTFLHIKNPNSIIEMAIDSLQNRGMKVEETTENKLTVIFGREHIDGQFQSINPSFHRLRTHAAVITAKVLKLVSNDCKIWIDNLKKHQSSKFIFYTVDLYYQKLNLLS